MKGKIKFFVVHIVLSLSLFSASFADYECVCANIYGIGVRQRDDIDSYSIGDLNAWDCKPRALNVQTSDGWYAVWFYNHLGFVSSNVYDSRIMTCHGDIPRTDLYPTTTTTTSTTSTATPKPTTTQEPTTNGSSLLYPSDLTTTTATATTTGTTPRPTTNPSTTTTTSTTSTATPKPTTTQEPTTNGSSLLYPSVTTHMPMPTSSRTTTFKQVTTERPITSTMRTTTSTSGGDICLTCTDSPRNQACLYTMTCEAHESCYTDAFENPNFDIIFNMGCRDTQLCGSSGKREVVNRSSGNTLLCTQCCTGNICNAALCGQTGLPSVGPVCFKCDQASTPTSCNQITLCERNEVCVVEKIISPLIHPILYKSGCYNKTQCDRHAHNLSLVGRKRYDNTLMSGNDLQIKCCDSNLCNHGHA